MAEYRIVSRGEYKKSDKDLPVTVDSYVLAENDEGRFLMLRFDHEKDADLSDLTINVSLYNGKGKYIKKINVEQPLSQEKGRFVLNRQIEVPLNCVKFKVEICSAQFGKYRYSLKDGEMVLDYLKQGGKVYDATPQIKAYGKDNCVASERRLSSPLLLTVLSVLLIACATVLTLLQLGYFTNTAEGFREGGVQYTFVADKNGDYTGITVTGYSGLTKKVTIPSEIGGYTVLSIGSYAFEESDITSVTIEGNPEIETYAFYNCKSLAAVSLANVTDIGQYAFSGCSALESVEIGGAEDITVTIGSRAFANCTSLKSVSINSPTSYASSVNVFYRCTALEELHLYNLNTDSDDTVTVSNFCGDGSTKALKDLYVHSLGYIGPSTFSGLNITSLSVDVMESGEIPSSAFSNCAYLETLDLPVKITYVGESAFYNCGISSLDLSETEYIGKNAFYGSGLKTLDLSANSVITEIAEYTFFNCTGLTSVSLPYFCSKVGNYAFCNCYSLASLTLNNKLEEIGLYAFGYCASLPSVNFNESLSVINTAAFYGCTSLVSVSFPENLGYICDYAFSGCTSLASVTLPENVAGVYNFAFSGCKSLVSVTFPKDFVSINSYVFSGCTALSSVTFPENLVGIGSYAFSDCASLASLTFPETLVSVYEYAFSGCTSLASVSFPESLAYIYEYAFSGCTSLTSLAIPETVQSLGHGAFSGCTAVTEICFSSMPNSLIYYFDTIVPSSLKTVTIESGTVPDYAFSDCADITTVNLPQDLVSIGNSTFSGCTSIEAITLPETVQEICVYAFYGCTALKEIVFPESLRYIDGYAFYECSSLSYAELNSGLEYIYDSAFMQCYNLREVCNYSSLDIVAENVDYGMVAAYALIVYTDAEQRKSTATMAFNDINLMRAGGVWYVISSSGTSASLSLSAFSYSGVTISSFKIASYAFYRNTSLTSVTLDSGVTAIGRYAFYGCNNLASVKTGNSVTEIGYGAFADCANLASVTFGSGLKTIKGSAFSNCAAMTSLTLPASLTAIEEYAFFGLSALTSLTFGSGLNTIGAFAFAYCNNLTELDLPSSLTEIDMYAFAGLTSLSVLILRSAPFIDSCAFENCYQLYEVYDLGGLGVTAGSEDNGMAGCYALCVYTSLTEERRLVVSDDYIFLKNNGLWSLYSYSKSVNGTLVLPDTFTAPDGSTVTYYIISDYAFNGLYIWYLVIPEAVSGMAQYALSGLSYNRIYFNGTQSEWESMCSLYLYNVFYYASCVHEDGYWTYDSNGNIVDSVSSKEVTETAATCSSEGKVNVVCNVCGEIIGSYNTGKLNHTFGADGVCSVCGLQGELVTGTDDGLEYLGITNDANNPYVYEDDKWHSVNSAKGSYSDFIVTAKKAVTVYITLICSAASTDRITVTKTFADGSQTTVCTLSGTSSGTYVIDLAEGESLTVRFTRNGSNGGTNCAYIVLVACPPDGDDE